MVLRRIQGARVGRKTALAVVVLALLVWGVVFYVNARDIVPPELRGTSPSAQP